MLRSRSNWQKLQSRAGSVLSSAVTDGRFHGRRSLSGSAAESRRYLGPWSARLRIESHRRSADSLRAEVDVHFNAVGNLDEGNTFVHAVVLTVEGHCPFDRAGACPFPGNCKS